MSTDTTTTTTATISTKDAGTVASLIEIECRFLTNLASGYRRIEALQRELDTAYEEVRELESMVRSRWLTDITGS